MKWGSSTRHVGGKFLFADESGADYRMVKSGEIRPQKGCT
jgi:hypothetical protein